MQFYSPLPCLKRAIVCLEEGDADAALEEVACVGDDAADIQTCEAFILKGFAEILSGSSLFAGSAVSFRYHRSCCRVYACGDMVGPPLQLRNALEYWADMRVSPKAPLLYSHSDIQMMVTILTDKSLDKDIKLAKAMALLPERFRPADTPGEVLCAGPEWTNGEGLT